MSVSYITLAAVRLSCKAILSHWTACIISIIMNYSNGSTKLRYIFHAYILASSNKYKSCIKNHKQRYWMFLCNNINIGLIHCSFNQLSTNIDFQCAKHILIFVIYAIYLLILVIQYAVTKYLRFHKTSNT